MALIICPECKNQISDKATECPHCGISMSNFKKCPECGALISLSNNRCPKCGFPFDMTETIPERKVNNSTSEHPDIISDNQDSIFVYDTDANSVSIVEKGSKKKHPKRFLKIFGVFTMLAGIAVGIFLLIQPKIRLKNVDKSVVKIVCYDAFDDEIASGSGFYYRGGACIVTNYHVIQDAARIKYINYLDVTKDIGCILWYSQKFDIAVLFTDNSTSEKTISPSKRKAKKGDKIYALGSPLGIQNTLSEGIISSFESIDGVNYIQFTAPISPGSSGGVLLDSSGRALGITTASYENGQNINLAIPISFVENIWPNYTKYIDVSPSDFFATIHPYGHDLVLLNQLGKIEKTSLYDVKNNPNRFMNGMYAFQAYISSIYDYQTGTKLYFLTDYANVSGDVEADLVDYFQDGVQDTPLLLARTYGEKHSDNLYPGELVWVVTFPAEKDIFDSFILYDEENGMYASAVEMLIDTLRTN